MDGDLGDLLLGVDLLGEVLDRVDGGLDGGLDALLQAHRVGAGGHVAQALVHHRPRQHGGGGGAVTGDVVGLLGDFLDQLGPDLLVRVLELDLLGDGDAVVGDGGRAPLLLQHDVAALRAEGDADGVGELVHALLERTPSLLVEGDHLRHLVQSSVGRFPNGMLPRSSHSRSVSASTLTPRVLTGNQQRSMARSLDALRCGSSPGWCVRCSTGPAGAGDADRGAGLRLAVGQRPRDRARGRVLHPRDHARAARAAELAGGADRRDHPRHVGAGACPTATRCSWPSTCRPSTCSAVAAW